MTVILYSISLVIILVLLYEAAQSKMQIKNERNDNYYSYLTIKKLKRRIKAILSLITSILIINCLIYLLCTNQ
jgi:hypothetical protein